MIADEIQSGLGRTGRLWACDNWGVTPDVMTLAKGLAGGVPIGATVARREILRSLKKGEQSSTFGGNPLACSAGIATLDYIQQNDLPKRALTLGATFMEGLHDLARRHRIIREARGMGLMLALEMRVDIQEILLAAIRGAGGDGVLFTYSGRTVIRMLPPLVMSEDHVRTVLAVLDAVLTTQEEALATPRTTTPAANTSQPEGAVGSSG
jgi:acetylornithine/LysW-gamma-L-lysine aminotransferase